MDRRQTSSFLCKKGGLFTFCLIGIIGTIVVAAIASSIIDNYVDKEYKNNIYYKNDLDSIKVSCFLNSDVFEVNCFYLKRRFLLLIYLYNLYKLQNYLFSKSFSQRFSMSPTSGGVQEKYPMI